MIKIHKWQISLSDFFDIVEHASEKGGFCSLIADSFK
jgi:hypothetical protein